MVWLWTDVLVVLLLLAALLMVFYMRSQAHLKRPLAKLVASPIAMGSFALLMSFALIGLMDSLHFKAADSQRNELVSLLDLACTNMRTHTETSYSAPFAAYAFNKQMLTGSDGSTYWGFARLQHAATHLQVPEQQLLEDVLWQSVQALLQSFAVVGVLIGLAKYSNPRRFWFPDSIRTVWLVFTLIGSGLYWMWVLSHDYHVLGTDKVGEDVLYQALKSIRTGLVIGCLTTLVMLPFALMLGILAGFFKGWIDDLIQFVYTTLNSIPSVLLIAASILMVQVYMANHGEDFNNLLVRADMRLLFLCLILGVTSWTGLCRLLRAETLKLREMEYVMAAQALGVRPGMILFRHILPNVMHIVLISVVLDFSSLVLAEAALSYINIGVDPTTHSWGNMINSARLEMAREPVVWWPLMASFVFMFTLVLAANLFADQVRDAFDPRRSA